jgi:hypothetical protein
MAAADGAEACQARTHGTKSAYASGCRCPDAVAANRLANARRRRLTATGRQPSRIRDVDQVAVDSVIAGYRVNLTCREIRVAIRRLSERRLSPLAIAIAVGVTERTVQRCLSATRQAAIR